MLARMEDEDPARRPDVHDLEVRSNLGLSDEALAALLAGEFPAPPPLLVDKVADAVSRR